jgi:bilin biosynthesis protein
MGAAAVPLLIDILKAPDTPETTCGHAAWALAFIGVEAEPFLYQEFKSDLPRVRAAVVGAIAKVAQEHPEIQTAIELPLQALDDEDAIVRNEAISALANLDRVSALPQILQLLEHEDPETRKSVALATMKLGSGADIERLQAAMTKETEPGLQSVFKLAISQLERKTAGDDWD